MNAVMQSAGWVTLGRAFAKLIALMQMVTLGRLIGPELYPVFGVVLVVIGVLEVLTEQGLSTALIQRPGSIDAYVDTVWTTNILRGVILGGVLVLLGPWLASMLRSPDSAPLLQVMGLLPFLKGWESLASVTLARKMHFRPLVLLECLGSLASLLSALGVYFAGGGLWSLVVGQLVMGAVIAGGSYALVPRRPRFHFDWNAYRQLQSFGIWVMVSRYASAVLTRGGEIAVTLFLPPTMLSFYQYADQLTSSATVEISRIANRLTLPWFSQQVGDLPALTRGLQQSLFFVAQVSALACMVMAVTSTEVIMLLLGERWSATALLIPTLALWGFCRSVGACLSGFLLATNRPREASNFQLIMVVGFLAGVYPATLWLGSQGVAGLLAVIGVATGFWRLRRIAQILELDRTWHALWPVWVPLASATVGWGAVQLAPFPIVSSPDHWQLFLNAAAKLTLAGTLYAGLIWATSSWFQLPNEVIRLVGARLHTSFRPQKIAS